jgi:hypothetical protein
LLPMGRDVRRRGAARRNCRSRKIIKPVCRTL